MYGELENPISANELKQKLEKTLQRTVILCDEFVHSPQKMIKTIGICSGGQGYIDLAFEKAVMPLLVAKFPNRPLLCP